MGLLSSSRSTTNQSTTNNLFDQRSVNDAGGGIIGSGNTVDSSQNSWTLNDSRAWTDASYRDNSFRQSISDDRDVYAVDNSNRSIQANDSRDQSFRQSISDDRDFFALDNSNRSVQLTDSRDLSTYWVDGSNRSTSSYSLDSSNRSVQLTDSRDLSTYWVDGSNRSTSSYSLDGSNRSTTTNNLQMTDPGAVRLGELNAQLFGAFAESQTDAVRFMTDAGRDVIKSMGASATQLFSQANSANERSWAYTVDAARDVVEGLMSGAQRTTDAARVVAQSAVSAIGQAGAAPAPAENSKLLMLAGAAVLAFAILRG